MKMLHFDPFCGASGDMMLAAVFDLGIKPKAISDQLKGMAIPEFRLSARSVDNNGISCKRCIVKVPKEHKHRNLSNISNLIVKSKLSPSVKEWSRAIFYRIAKAEAKIHKTDINKVHFHEVGALDSIIDVVGSCIGFDLLGITDFTTGSLAVGTGTIQCRHGVLPVPCPATSEIIKGFPARILETGTEILTPTGAGIITSLASPATPEKLVLSKIGYGAGQKTIPGFPNYLRLLFGEKKSQMARDRVCVLETNLDDCSPEVTAYAMEKLFEAGALDVFLQPVTMKKGRPGLVLTAVADENKGERIASTMLNETTSIGVRYFFADRIKLRRDIVKMKSPWGILPAKRIQKNGKTLITPEFEACKKVAVRKKISLQTVFNWVNSRNK